MEFLKKNGLMIILAIIAGAIAMDYYNYMKSKDKGYSKIAGFFKYSAPEGL
jgi:hypothetical protein